MASTHTQQLSRPQLPRSVVIRAAEPPYSPGVLAQICLPSAAAARLRAHEVVNLMPRARWVGGGAAPANA
jgi:hypothetical protein